MGPTLLLDKSSLQSISRREVGFLFKHYTVVLPHVLIAEILGDLKKGDEGGGLSRDEVKAFAQKILSMGPLICAPRRDLCAMSLFGHDISMELGQVPTAGGIEYETPDGKRGIFYDEPPEMQALKNWAVGKFSEAEVNLASRWRETTLSLNLEAYKKKLLFNLTNFKPAESFEEIAAWADKLLIDGEMGGQMLLLKTLMDDLQFNDESRTRVMNRWMKSQMPVLKYFAPYAEYSIRTRLIFEVGLASGLITTRSTNRVDLIYLYYLPFCAVFSSGDLLHEKVVPALMRKNQIFVRRDDLKADLKNLAAEWDAMTEDQRLMRHKVYGVYPPETNPDSVTLKIWQRFCKPRTDASGDRVSSLTPEQHHTLIAEFQGMMAAVKEAKERNSSER